MSNDLKINTSLDAEQRLQQLLQRQADIQAEIASLVPSSAPATSYQHHRSPINKHHHRRSVNGINVPRNGVSSSGATMARQLSDRIEAPSMRSKTLSQRSAPAPSMARTNSRGASSARSGNTPFVKNGSAIPRPFRPEPRQDRDQNLAVDTWMNDNDNAYTLSHQPPPLQQSMSQRFELEQVPELGVGENPLEFISRTMGTPTVAISPPFSTSSAATMSNMHLSNNSFNLPTPTTPTTDSLTEATTFASTMSRQNSLCNERMLESLQMMHVNSNTSYSTDVNSDQFMYDHVNSSFSSPNRRSSSEEQSQLLVGTGGVSHDSQFSHSFSSADDFSSVGYGEKMEKSQSSESSSSNASSASSRNKERLSKTNTLAAARPLMPKGESAENILSRANSSKSMTRLESKDGSQDNKIAISKPSYQRPKHDRVHCKLCENHPDGFRGEHELRRHQDREHKTMVRKWVCIEPTSPGHPKPEMPLSKCKACGTQRKKYGAYYNAAAHLRRTHFRPKAKGRGKNSKVDDVEKRGGKGGGDWPSMQELKHWMTEVEVPCDNYPSSNTQEDEAEAEAAESSDNEQENNLDELETISTQTNTHNNFDSYAYINDASPININATNNDMYSSMPLDLTGTEQSSCQLDASLYGNANFQVYSNDAAMAGFDFSAVPMINQGFDDSILNGTYF